MDGAKSERQNLLFPSLLSYSDVGQHLKEILGFFGLLKPLL